MAHSKDEFDKFFNKYKTKSEVAKHLNTTRPTLDKWMKDIDYTPPNIKRGRKTTTSPRKPGVKSPKGRTRDERIFVEFREVIKLALEDEKKEEENPEIKSKCTSVLNSCHYKGAKRYRDYDDLLYYVNKALDKKYNK